MFKTSSFMKGRTLISVLQGSFLTAQSRGLCREGFMGEGNKGAWNWWHIRTSPGLGPSNCLNKQLQTRPITQQFGFSSVQQDATTLIMILHQSHFSQIQVAPTKPFLLPPNRPSLSAGLISGQQGNEIICTWISLLNQPEAENSALTGTLKVGFLPPFQNTSIRPGSSIISTVNILCRYGPDSTDQKCKLRKPRREKNATF